MDVQALENLGLTHNEALIYIALCRAGPLPAGALTKHVELHRSRIYDALTHLELKALVNHSLVNGVTHYAAREPTALLELADARRDEVKKLLPSLERIGDAAKKRTATESYVGIGGVKAVLSEFLISKATICTFGAPARSVEILGETFWKNYNGKVRSLGIHQRMIFNEELREWSKVIQSIDAKTSLRFFAKHFDPLTETMVAPGKVAIIVWSEPPVSTILRDDIVAKSYAEFFEILWKQAKA